MKTRWRRTPVNLVVRLLVATKVSIFVHHYEQKESAEETLCQSSADISNFLGYLIQSRWGRTNQHRCGWEFLAQRVLNHQWLEVSTIHEQGHISKAQLTIVGREHARRELEVSWLKVSHGMNGQRPTSAKDVILFKEVPRKCRNLITSKWGLNTRSWVLSTGYWFQLLVTTSPVPSPLIRQL